MSKITLTKEIDLQEEGLVRVEDMKKALLLLNDVYGRLWCEAYYDPYNEKFREFCAPLADKMSEANKILGFKK